MTAVEHQLSDIQRELGSISELLRGQFQRRPSGMEAAEFTSGDSLRRRKPTITAE